MKSAFKKLVENVQTMAYNGVCMVFETLLFGQVGAGGRSKMTTSEKDSQMWSVGCFKIVKRLNFAQKILLEQFCKFFTICITAQTLWWK